MISPFNCLAFSSAASLPISPSVLAKRLSTSLATSSCAMTNDLADSYVVARRSLNIRLKPGTSLTDSIHLGTCQILSR